MRDVPDPVLSGLFVYPVKSLAGIEVSSWQVNAKGLLHDRKWMLIDRDQQFLSQRKIPKMALIKTELTAQQLILSTACSGSVSLPINPSDGACITSYIWNDVCVAKSTSSEVSQWLSDFLGIQCQLVYQADAVFRPVDKRYAKHSDHINFADGFPFLIVSEPSLHALNQELERALEIQRFRPNLVVAQCAPYAEDSWRKISINQINFRLPKPCSRCVIPAIDPATASIGKEPLRTLNRLRKWNNRVYFGQNALHDNTGTLAVGNTVRIVRSGPANPPL